MTSFLVTIEFYIRQISKQLHGRIVTALLPSQCCHHAAVTPLTFHNQTVKLQSVTDDSKFIFFIYWREYKFNL